MQSDSGQLLPRHQSPDLRHLPDVLDLRIRRRRFDPPRRVTTQGVDREVGDAVEIEIRVSEPFTIRAQNPVVWVGDEPLTIGEGDGELTYRFFAFDPAELPAGAPISLGWTGARAPRKETAFHYEPPKQ